MMGARGERLNPAEELPILPHSSDAERAILGAILIDFGTPNNTIRAVLNLLNSGDFFLNAHRIIFQRMVAMAEAGEAIDLVTLCDELHHCDELEAAGGAGYVSSISDGLPRVNNVRHYADIVRRNAILRLLAHFGQRLVEAVQKRDASATDIFAEVRKLVSLVSSRQTSGLRMVTAEEFQAMELPPREMILDPLLPMQSLSLLYSKRGVGKTFVSVAIAHAIATGGSFLGWGAPKARSVLFVDGGLPARVLRDRLHVIGECTRGDADLKLLRLITPDLQSGPMPDLATSECQALVESHLDGTELLILDNLSSLCRAGKENEGEGWLPVQGWALRLRQRGLAILFVHHAGKGGAQRGTSRREDVVDLVISIRHPTDYMATEGLRFEWHIEKCRSLLGECARSFEVQLKRDPTGALNWTTRAIEDTLLARASELFADGVSVRDVAEELQISKSKAHRLKAKLGRPAGSR